MGVCKKIQFSGTKTLIKVQSLEEGILLIMFWGNQNSPKALDRHKFYYTFDVALKHFSDFFRLEKLKDIGKKCQLK